MTVEEHYRKLLQLPEPWEVAKIEEDLLGQRVTVWLRWPDGVKAACPDCAELMPIYDRLPERGWRHLSVMQYHLELRCAVPRCECSEHGVKTVRVPWAEPSSDRRKGSGFAVCSCDSEVYLHDPSHAPLISTSV